MRLSLFLPGLFTIYMLSLLQRFVFAIPKNYIVYLGPHHDEPHFLVDPESITRSHHNMLYHVSQSDSNLETSKKLIYSYNKVFNGFAATLHEREVEELKKHPDVVSIFESRLGNIQTTHSWEFLGLDRQHYMQKDKHQKQKVNTKGSPWEKARLVEDMIVAAIDTGVVPESKSFVDEGYGPIPKRFKGRCENEKDPSFRCNRKLIGARYFFKGYNQHLQSLKRPAFNGTLSPRDNVAHGTHVLSTAAGNFVPGVNVLGLANGTAQGGLPRARIVSYKVGWEGNQCTEMDILAAFEAAISDGVDIINLSLGMSPALYFVDSMAIGSYHAVQHGIFVAAAGGNTGPKAGTVSNLAPWILTVAGSNMDREIVNHVILGNKKSFKAGGFLGEEVADRFDPLVNGVHASIIGANITDAFLCKPGTLDPLKIKGKILVCPYDGEDISYTLPLAYKAGAAGLILSNDRMGGSNLLTGVTDLLPLSRVSYDDGEAIFSYINSTRSPVATIIGATTGLQRKPAPTMGSFSSRGPNLLTFDVLKPDVTAPGEQILAADLTSYDLKTGTSMACPHVSAIAGFIKAMHPDWSTTAIKSAIMTTASPTDNTGKTLREESLLNEATPFAYGAGHVRPKLATDPGLVYDMNHHDYLNFLCTQYGYNHTMMKKFTKDSYICPKSNNLWDFNYPSITINVFLGNETVTRKLKNVGKPGTYTARIEAPPRVSIMVEPNIMRFSAKGQVLDFKVIFKAPVNQLPSDYAFGSLVWSDGKHIVRSPIVLIPKGKLVRDFSPK